MGGDLPTQTEGHSLHHLRTTLYETKQTPETERTNSQNKPTLHVFDDTKRLGQTRWNVCLCPTRPCSLKTPKENDYKEPQKNCAVPSR